MKKISMLMKTGAAGILAAVAMTAGSVSAESDAVQLAQASGDFDPARVYTQSCSACHNSGAAGAPRFGNSEEWSERLEKGYDTLVQHTIEGFNNVMPPRGMCFDCTDEQLAEVVQYILDESVED